MLKQRYLILLLTRSLPTYMMTSNSSDFLIIQHFKSMGYSDISC